VRVAIVAECFLPALNGVTNSVLRTIEQLEHRGHDAIVIAPGDGPLRYGSTPIERVPGVALPMYKALSVALPTRRVFDELERFGPDVVHLAAPFALGASGARAAKQLGVPSIAIYQTDYAGFAARYGLTSLHPAVWRWLRHLHEMAARTLAPSTSASWQLQQHGIGPVELWARGVDLERFHPLHRSALLHRRLAGRDGVLVGYVGRLAKEKRVELLRHAAVPGVHLVVVGDGPARNRVARAVPGATFLGFLTGAALSEAVASLDVFVHTGADETFCQGVQEALAAGVPVVAPACGGPLDLVRHGENGFLYPPDDPGQLAGAVRRLVAEPDLRRAMGSAARRSVEKRNWRVIGDQLLAHYEAVGGPRRRRCRRVA
jgi:phosphatidylinositol alpha 1,6-mannosyltransferase